MKRKLLLPVLALTAFLGTLLSCSSDSDTASIQIPVTQIFRNVENDILPSDTNKIELEITLSGDAKDSHTFNNWKEEEQNCTFENLPVGGVVSVSAQVKDGEDLIYSGKSDKIKLKNEQNETTITMQKLMAKLTVKTDNKEIAGLTNTTEIIINAAAEGFSIPPWTITPKEFAAGYELKYLPVNKELTVTAKAKTKDTTIFRGSSKITIAEKDQNPECIKMERVNGDTSVEIQTLPTPELKAIYANGNTFSLTQDTEPPVARFTIYYTDSSTNPDKPTPKPLPEWVTYKWKMNGREFTPNDNSREATLGMDEGTEGRTLTIYLKKMKSLLPLGSQNSLYVEIGMENSEETKSTEIEFTITNN